jgi:ribonuclease P protein component
MSANTNGFHAKTMRLNSPQDFKRCFLKGERIKNDVFVLHYIDNGGLCARLGVNVAKKKIKNAVDRNKIKRAAREAFRRARLKNLDVVLILKNENNYDPNNCFLLVNEVFNDLKKK